MVYDYVWYIEVGGKFVEECDDEGWLIWFNDDLLEVMIYIVEDVFMLLCKVYVVVLYYYWEWLVFYWIGKVSEEYDKFVVCVGVMGILVDFCFYVLCDFVNLLKYVNIKWGEWLYKSWFEFFFLDFWFLINGGWWVDWYE